MSVLEYVKSYKLELQKVAHTVRALSMDAILKAKSGHTGVPLGCAEMGTLLYFAVMNHCPENSSWVNRDRFILSAGHGSMLQYSLLHLAGYNVSLEDLKSFRQLGSVAAGHPEQGHTDGVEMTTGPLGQGLASSTGFALAERMLAGRFGDIMNHRTFVIAGDGCMMEGVTAESCSLAGTLKLNKLIALYDDNKITIDGKTDITFTENVALRYESYGWNVLHADGNNLESLAKAMDNALKNATLPQNTTGPTLIVCKTIPGKGSPKWEGQHKIHGNPMSSEDVLEAKKHLGCPEEAFVVPHDVASFIQESKKKWIENWRNWEKSLEEAKAQFSEAKMQEWEHCFEVSAIMPHIPQDLKTMATRQSGGEALKLFASHDLSLVGGSADLAGSTLTTLPNTSFISSQNFEGRNIHFGIREHAMGSICNGISAHGGFRPYCATFAVFSDYMKAAVRMSALMKQPVTYIFTHDSIGVGEDGPTHQPIEHLSGFRAMPQVQTIRPADAFETFLAWELAYNTKDKPTCLFLSRQDAINLDTLYLRDPSIVQKDFVKGGYVLKSFEGLKNAHSVVIVASGTEVGLACEVAKNLQGQKKTFKGKEAVVDVQIVSCPMPQVLATYKEDLNQMIPADAFHVVIEAGASWGWGQIVHRDACFITMETFGASAPLPHLLENFGFTPTKVIEKIAQIFS